MLARLSARRSIPIVLLLSANWAVLGEDNTEPDSQYLHYADQYARCAVFFAIAAEALAALGDSKTALTYQEYQYGAMIDADRLAALVGDGKESLEILGTLIEKYEKQMLDALDGSNEKVVTLVTQHHEYCVSLLQNPPRVVRELGPF